MTYIRKQTPKDSVILSYWCPGHFIKCKGGRRVFWDGASIGNAIGNDVVSIFISTDERFDVEKIRLMAEDVPVYVLVWDGMFFSIVGDNNYKLSKDSLIAKMVLWPERLKYFELVKGNGKVKLYKIK